MSPLEEVNTATGEAPEQDLEARAEQLRQVAAKPTERERAASELREIEHKLAEQREAAGVEAAKSRLLGIRRAYGSLVDQLDQDTHRVERALEAARETIREANERYEKIALLDREASALSDRFGVERRGLPPISPLSRRGIRLDLPTLRDRDLILPVLEEDDTKLRRRRTYAEADGTPGYAVIQLAGLRDFSPLTSRQQQMVAAREREQARERRQIESMPTISADAPTGGNL